MILMYVLYFIILVMLIIFGGFIVSSAFEKDDDIRIGGNICQYTKTNCVFDDFNTNNCKSCIYNKD